MEDVPFIYLNYERPNEKVGERLIQNLAATMPWIRYFDDSQVGSADRWEQDIRRAIESANVLVQLIGGSGGGTPNPSAAQSSVFRDVRKSGGAVISVLVEGDPGAVASSRMQADGPVRVLREKHWDDDVRELTALIGDLIGARVVANMLPPSTSGLVDRAEVRTVLDGLRAGSVVAVVGAGGFGKTALAQVAARQAADRFPDGVLWANLEQEGSAAAAVGTFLQALGIDLHDRESGPEALIRRFRKIVREKRLLIVLDGGLAAADAEPLLTPGPHSAVLVTGRVIGVPLGPETVVVKLGGMSDEAALDLLRQTAGASVADADPASATRIVQLAKGSPLLLSLVGSQARREGAGSLPSFVDQFADSTGTLGQRLLRRIYEDLPPGRQRLLRLLGALSTPVFETGLAAAMAESDATTVTAELRALADANLINELGRDRFHLSELTLRFAADELHATESEEERRAAVARMVRWMAVSTAFEPDMPITRDFWTADDALGYAPYADAIAAFIRHRGTRPPLTIGVTAPWGAGKTSLMRMVQERLDPRADRGRWTATSVRLSDEARRSLRPKRGATDEPVTNRELLDRTTEPVPDTDDLDVQPPRTLRGCRMTSGVRPSGSTRGRTRAASRSGRGSRTRSSPRSPAG